MTGILQEQIDKLTKDLDVARAAVGGPLYNEWSQRWVDETCHYRNLAIALGAKPEDMWGKYDRDLCERGVEGWEQDYTTENEARECWQDLEAAESEVARLRTALERIYQSGRGLHVEIARDALNA